MSDITKEYLTLFQAITQAINTLDQVRQELLDAQILAEALYIDKE